MNNIAYKLGKYQQKLSMTNDVAKRQIYEQKINQYQRVLSGGAGVVSEVIKSTQDNLKKLQHVDLDTKQVQDAVAKKNKSEQLLLSEVSETLSNVIKIARDVKAKAEAPAESVLQDLEIGSELPTLDQLIKTIYEKQLAAESDPEKRKAIMEEAAFYKVNLGDVPAPKSIGSKISGAFSGLKSGVTNVFRRNKTATGTPIQTKESPAETESKRLASARVKSLDTTPEPAATPTVAPVEPVIEVAEKPRAPDAADAAK